MIALLLWVAAIPVLMACLYLLLLTLASAEVAPPPPGGASLRFDLLVPAHDEEASIAETVAGLKQLDWPADRFRVVVIADNCSDETAARARAAGAEVWERQDPERRGKGYALQLGYARALQEATCDALVVIDADSAASPNLLAAFAARLAVGARALQADYAVRNPNASWRTRLMAIAFSMFHALRSNGRERLGLSCGLRGNGMCFARGLLEEIPHGAFSLVEDVEYGLRLGEAGVRVASVGEAHVFGEMVAGEQGSRSQRQRWEGGRAQLARLHGWRLVRAGLGKRSALLLDLGLDVLLPPLSRIALAALLGAGLTSIAIALHAASAATLMPWLACFGALFLYVGRGWMLSHTGLRGVLDLTRAPLYMLWTLGLRLRSAGTAKVEWVRTARGEDRGE